MFQASAVFFFWRIIPASLSYDKRENATNAVLSALLIMIVFGTKSTFAALKMESGTVKNSLVPMEDSPPSVSESVTPAPDQDGYILTGAHSFYLYHTG